MSFSDFFQQNIVFFIAAAGLLAYLMFSEVRGLAGKKAAISPSALSQAVNRGATLVDLRAAEDFQTSHIAGAINVPLAELDNSLEKLGDKEKAVVLYCYKGVSSASAVASLQKNGFTNVSHLNGGMNAWATENLPTAKA